MPTAYNHVFDGKKTYVKTSYSDQSTLSVQATKLCDSCHDPDDQGGDPAKMLGGRNYGPQGGDSRAYVTSAHASLGCVDCHKTHDFAPEQDSAAVKDGKCNALGCHTTARKLGGPSDPGFVHTNHIP